jgi:hypothetical protein
VVWNGMSVSRECEGYGYHVLTEVSPTSLSKLLNHSWPSMGLRAGIHIRQPLTGPWTRLQNNPTVQADKCCLATAMQALRGRVIAPTHSCPRCYVPAAFYLRERTAGIRWIGRWVGLNCLDTEAGRKFLCFCRESNPGRPMED